MDSAKWIRNHPFLAFSSLPPVIAVTAIPRTGNYKKNRSIAAWLEVHHGDFPGKYPHRFPQNSVGH